MRINAVRFFLIISFIVAQFFTQQLHEFTHLISQTGCEPKIEAGHVASGLPTVSPQEKHEHCKFLQLIAHQHIQPFLILNSGEQIHALTFQNFKPTTIQHWISYSDSNYHQARAPPVV